MNNKETTKQHTVKELRKFQANTTTKRGEAYIALTKTADDKMGIGWKGTKRDLLNILYTAIKNDRELAAIICQVAKDHVESCKTSNNAWAELTSDIAQLQRDI